MGENKRKHETIQTLNTVKQPSNNKRNKAEFLRNKFECLNEIQIKNKNQQQQI